MNRIPVIMDVDTGLDDALAILLASDSPALQIIGIACVNGNVSVEESYRNTRYIAKTLKLKVPVSKGAAYPMVNKILHAQNGHKSAGLGNIKIEIEPEKHTLLASAMYEQLLTEALEPVTIIATGPLTNLAHLIQNHPEVKPKIKTISFMGGSLTGGNITNTAEFNAHVDPEALAVVLKSEIPLIMTGLNLSTTVRITLKDVKNKIKEPLPIQQLFIELIEFYIATAQSRGQLNGAALHDMLAVAAITVPDTFESEQKAIVVNTSKDERRGETSAEGEVPNATVLTSINPKTIIELTLNSVRHLERVE